MIPEEVSYWQGREDALMDAAQGAEVKAGQAYTARLDEHAARWREVADWLWEFYKDAQTNRRDLENGITDTDCK